MPLFPYGHATHPDWQTAASLVLLQVRAQMLQVQTHVQSKKGATSQLEYANSPTLALLYITDHFAENAPALLSYLRSELPEVRNWCGAVGLGVLATGVEYFDEPALSLMLCDLPLEQIRVFSGAAPLDHSFGAHNALIHADGDTPDIADLLTEMADRTLSGRVFGGLVGSRSHPVQFALSSANDSAIQKSTQGVLTGGLSGVAFSRDVSMVTRISQACSPIAPAHRITDVDGSIVLKLDNEPALDVLLRDLSIKVNWANLQDNDLDSQQALNAVRNTLVGIGLTSHQHVDHSGHFGSEVLVRHIVGLDIMQAGIVVAHAVQKEQSLTFCRRKLQAASADLMRICAEMREELHPYSAAESLDQMLKLARPIRGAIYVSCVGRGGRYFGKPNAELELVRHALGDVPLVGFFANGEIAQHHIYGYTGVLTIFTD